MTLYDISSQRLKEDVVKELIDQLQQWPGSSVAGASGARRMPSI